MPIQRALVKLSRKQLMINVNIINGKMLSKLLIKRFIFTFIKNIKIKLIKTQAKTTTVLGKKNITVAYAINIIKLINFIIFYFHLQDFY